MQFHLNGFQPGDPEKHDAAPGRSTPQVGFPSELDVLIVGSGPSGLTLAAQLARYPAIDARIIERKDCPMTRGQADGISCRSMEMFGAFGFADRVAREAYWVNETTFWKPDPDNPTHIIRSGRVQDVEDGLSEMPHVILNQARVHDMYLDIMRRSPSRLEVDYRWQLSSVIVGDGDYPVRVNCVRPDDAGAQRQLRCR